MIKTTKVFIIIGIIFGAPLIYPVVLGILAIKKLNNAETTEELTTWGILTIFFVSFIGGILMLNVKQKDIDSIHFYEDSNQSGFNPNNDPSVFLVDLKKLYDDGVIDEVTYQSKRRKYLDNL
jgi:hypothetical protein